MLPVWSLTDAHVVTTLPPASSVSPSPVCIVIFVATIWEFAAVRAAFPGGRMDRVHGRSRYRVSTGAGECWVIQTGVGPQKARETARAVLARQAFALAISSGFACALRPADVGDILIGTRAAAVETDEAALLDYVEVEGHERERWRAALSMSANPTCSNTAGGTFISSDRIVHRAAEKVALAQRTQATGLDMESAALAREAKAAQVPFLIVRAVSDLLMEELPLDFNLFLRPTGWLKGLCALFAHPSSLSGLARLRRQSVVAAGALTECLQDACNARFGIRPDSPMTMTP
jgi:adenosylhomocysteine nucleosidase